MTHNTQFDALETAPRCAVCSGMLADAVEGLLSPAEQAAFDRHLAASADCTREFAEAHRGVAWLSLLKSQAPEPPPALLARILAQTSGAAAATSAVAYAEPVPAWTPAAAPRRSSIAVWLRQLSESFSLSGALQPRMAMTAAMAFFSVALTLNLTGVRLGSLRADNFTPGGLRRSVVDLGASASRTFQNSRVVYQVESRVSALNDNAPLNNRQPH